MPESNEQPPEFTREPEPDAGDDSAQNTASELPISPAPRRPSGHAIALDNEIAMLEALWKFHWLTSRQLHSWLNTSVNMVRRTMRRLIKQRQVSRIRLPNGVWVYFLALRGADRLRAETGAEAEAVRVRSFGTWEHRAICNWHVIHLNRLAATNGASHQLKFFSEYEVQTGRAPLHSWNGKIPDALGILTKADFTGYEQEFIWWMEVENSRRSDRDRKQLADFLIPRLRNRCYKEGLDFGGLLLISTHRPLLIEVGRYLRRQMDERGLEPWDRRNVQHLVRLSTMRMSSGLIFDGYETFHKLMHDFDPEFDD